MSRRKKLQEMASVAEEISAEARQIFAHLPEGEITDNENLHMAHVSGRVIIARDNDTYWLEGDCVVRLTRVAEGLQAALFRDGLEVTPPPIGVN